jgi:hypothetical protein
MVTDICWYKIVYHSYIHSIINYRITFWENSPYSNSIFKLQKRIIRIIADVGIRDSCREFFKILNILPLISQHIFSLLLSVVNNKEKFRMNSGTQSIRTRNTSDFYQPFLHLIIYQKGPFYMVIKIYNSLTHEINELSHNVKETETSLRRFHHQKSFYTIDKYLNYKAVALHILITKFMLIILSLVYSCKVCFIFV